MKTARTALSVLSLASALACQPQLTGFAGLPSDEAVTLRVPGTAEKGLQQALLGDVSEFYVDTYRISRGINGHVLGLLHGIREIGQQPATSHEGNTWVWGPYTPGGLEPLTFRFTAVQTAENVYSLNLEARPRRSADDADFRTLLDGESQVSPDGDGRGKGTLVLHFDSWGAMSPAVLERGEIAISYDALAEPRRVDVDFIHFAGNQESPADATYAYLENADSSGSFLFSIQANIHRGNENLPGLETVTLRSRWVASGAGRGDVTITGAEVAGQLSAAGLPESSVAATECWGEDFTVVFQDTAPEALRASIRPLQGAASACAVAAPDYPAAL